MLVAIEGIAGSGKSTVRDRLLAAATRGGVPMVHVGQFAWLSLDATRTIVALRAGRTAPETAAIAAVRDDLTLHARHNLAQARSAGAVVADRLSVSTGCLLALLYDGPVRRYLAPLAEVEAARPNLTILLTTPVATCLQRLQRRSTGRRFGETPATAARLAALYQEAAQAWTEVTGDLVLTRPCIEPGDADLLVTTVLEHLPTGCTPSGARP